MELTNRHIALLEKQHKDLLTSEESDELDNLLKDPKFAEIAFEYLHLFNEIEAGVHVELRDKMNQWEKHSSKRSYQLRPWMKFAATFLIIATVASLFYLNDKHDSKQLDSYYKVYPNVLTMRGDSASKGLPKALQLYDQQDYQACILALEELDGEDVQFYKAQSYFGLKDYEKANELFQRLDQSDSKYSDAITWYMALCEVKMNTASADELLQKVADSNSAYAADAEALLRMR